MTGSLLRSFGLRRRYLALPGIKQFARMLSQRGLVSDFLLRGVPIDEPGNLTLDEHALRYWFDTEQGLDYFLYWRGFKAWEYQSVSSFSRLARSARTVIDVGANTGVYSLIAAAANPNARIHAFEPTPSTYKSLIRNVALNGIEVRCQPYQIALSNSIGSANFDLPADLTMARMIGTATPTSIEVPVSTLDTVVDITEPIDLIKIDVEGFEDLVLEGATGILRQWKPAILFELLPGGPAERIENLLGPLGYRFQCILGSGPVDIERLTDEHAPHNNFLALSRQ